MTEETSPPGSLLTRLREKITSAVRGEPAGPELKTVGGMLFRRGPDGEYLRVKQPAKSAQPIQPAKRDVKQLLDEPVQIRTLPTARKISPGEGGIGYVGDERRIARYEEAYKDASGPLVNRLKAILEGRSPRPDLQWSYEQYCATHPSLVTNGIQLHEWGSPVSVVDEAHKARFATLKISRTGVNLAVLQAATSDEIEDAGGIEMTPNGKLNVVLSDGAGGCVLPNVAARSLVETGLREMRSAPPSRGLIQTAQRTLNIQPLADLAVKRAIDDIDAVDHTPDITLDTRLSRRTTHLGHLGREPGIATATFAAMQYDKETEDLSAALRGDSEIIIFRATGQYERTATSSDQVQYGQTSQILPDDIAINTRLQPGDVAMIFSDGVTRFRSKDIINKINTNLNNARQDPAQKDRLDYVANNTILQELQKEGEIADDILSIAIHRR